jgi:hypothetical protein
MSQEGARASNGNAKPRGKGRSSEIETMDTEGNQFQANNSHYDSLHHSERSPQRCANCDIEILWPPTVVEGKTYCCVGCAAGGPCSCDYSQYRSVNIAGVIHYLGRD